MEEVSLLINFQPQELSFYSWDVRHDVQLLINRICLPEFNFFWEILLSKHLCIVFINFKNCRKPCKHAIAKEANKSRGVNVWITRASSNYKNFKLDTCKWTPTWSHAVIARQSCCMAGKMKMFCIKNFFFSRGKRIYCFRHATWLPCKTSIACKMAVKFFSKQSSELNLHNF